MVNGLWLALRSLCVGNAFASAFPQRLRAASEAFADLPLKAVISSSTRLLRQVPSLCK